MTASARWPYVVASGLLIAARWTGPAPALFLFATADFLAVTAFLHSVPALLQAMSVALARFPLRFPAPTLTLIPPPAFLPPFVPAVVVVVAQDLANDSWQVLRP